MPALRPPAPSQPLKGTVELNAMSHEENPVALDKDVESGELIHVINTDNESKETSLGGDESEDESEFLRKAKGCGDGIRRWRFNGRDVHAIRLIVLQIPGLQINASRLHSRCNDDSFFKFVQYMLLNKNILSLLTFFLFQNRLVFEWLQASAKLKRISPHSILL